MQSILHVVIPAKCISLVALYEVKSLLNIPATDATRDEQLQFMIDRSSGEIATFCNNRVFAEETVIESFFQVNGESRLYLSRRPVRADKIISITCNGMPFEMDTHYVLDPGSGTLHSLSGVWTAPVVIKYTGGYRLPNESPHALRQAAMILARESYFAAARGDSSVRMISHKESRVMYHPPGAEAGAAAKSSASGPGMVTQNRAVNDILTHFMRFEI